MAMQTDEDDSVGCGVEVGSPIAQRPSGVRAVVGCELSGERPLVASCHAGGRVLLVVGRAALACELAIFVRVYMYACVFSFVYVCVCVFARAGVGYGVCSHAIAGVAMQSAICRKLLVRSDGGCELPGERSLAASCLVRMH